MKETEQDRQLKRIADALERIANTFEKSINQPKERAELIDSLVSELIAAEE